MLAEKVSFYVDFGSCATLVCKTYNTLHTFPKPTIKSGTSVQIKMNVRLDELTKPKSIILYIS